MKCFQEARLITLFQRDKSSISRHIKNIFSEGELVKESVVAYFATTAAEVIYARADAEKEFMGLTTFAGNQPILKEAVDKATDEYKKYKARTISDVEADYLNSIKMLEQKTNEK